MNHSANETLTNVRLKSSFVVSLFTSFSLAQLEATEFYTRRVIVLDTLKEDAIFGIFEKHPILPSSEIFYFLETPDELMVKQSK